MITLITGNKNTRKSFIEKICREQNIPTERIHHFYPEDFLSQIFRALIPYNLGLFGERECFVLNDMLSSLDIPSILDEYKTTEHIVIFSEEKSLKKNLKFFEERELPVHVFPDEMKKKRDNSIFALADAFGRRDKKNLWLLFREEIEKGSSPEEIHGILFWALKNLALVRQGDTKRMKAFIVKKNQTFLKNFSDEDILRMNAELRRIFHERDLHATLEIKLEKFILSL